MIYSARTVLSVVLLSVLFFASKNALSQQSTLDEWQEGRELKGIMIDLEKGSPSLSRHKELSDAVTKGILGDLRPLGVSKITLKYVHFTKVDSIKDSDLENIDFVLLSPQGTPWYAYKGSNATALEQTKELIRSKIIDSDIALLGICGGHQFLAKVYDSAVDYIDSRYIGSHHTSYPSDAKKESGSVTITMEASDDPIFEGVVANGQSNNFDAMENHREEIKTLQSPLENLASSQMTKIQTIHIPGKAVYGTQFHPERGWDNTQGKIILTNFFKMVFYRGHPPY